MERKRRLGDRKDGRKIRTLDPMSRVAIFIMKDRNDALNYYSESFDTEEIDRYIRKKRAEGLKGFGVMHIIIASYIRAVSQRPGLNRFVSGQTLYSRDEAVVALTIKKELKLNAQETIIKPSFPLDATAEDVYRKFTELIETNKSESESSSFDNTAKILNYIPRLLLRFIIGFLKMLDYFGLLPKFLTDLSPFHASFFITSMGSLGILPIYHHLYNFGNVPIFCSFGARRSEMKLESDGSVKRHWYIDLKLVMDERICDGHYYASALKLFRELIRHPEQLDNPPAEIVKDID